MVLTTHDAPLGEPAGWSAASRAPGDETSKRRARADRPRAALGTAGWYPGPRDEAGRDGAPTTVRAQRAGRVVTRARLASGHDDRDRRHDRRGDLRADRVGGGEGRTGADPRLRAERRDRRDRGRALRGALERTTARRRSLLLARRGHRARVGLLCQLAELVRKRHGLLAVRAGLRLVRGGAVSACGNVPTPQRFDGDRRGDRARAAGDQLSRRPHP